MATGCFRFQTTKPEHLKFIDRDIQEEFHAKKITEITAEIYKTKYLEEEDTMKLSRPNGDKMTLTLWAKAFARHYL